MTDIDVPLPGLASLRRTRPSTVRITTAARRSFWRRVRVTDSGCWIWTGAVASDGYGRITWTHHGVPRTLSTHRFALTLALGTIPAGIVAAHGCDHPLCVRFGAGHVHPSTQSANLHHAIDAGRHDNVNLVVDSTRRRQQSLTARAMLLGRCEPQANSNSEQPEQSMLF